MSTIAHPAAVSPFMVVGTIRPDTDPADMAALRAAEERQLPALHAEGRIGTHHVAPARRTVFLAAMAAEERQVAATLATLPFAAFFDVESCPLAPPDAPGGASDARP